MGLVVEANGGRGLARRHAVKQKAAGQVDPSARQVLVRADSELAAEHAHQVGGVGVDRVRGLPEGDFLPEAFVEQVAKLLGEIGSGRLLLNPGCPVQVMLEPFCDEGQSAFRLQLAARLVQRVMQLVDALPQEGVEQHGLVNRLADEGRGQVREVEVDDPLVKARRGRRAAVVRDLRREQGDGAMERAMLVAVQVIADHPVVHDQQRPRLMRVHGIDVAGHVGVEDLGDAGNLRSPGPDPRGIGVFGHAKIVQDQAAGYGVRLLVMSTSMPDGVSPDSAPDSEPVRFDTKIAVLLRSDLEVWQRLNVTAFLVSGLGQRVPEVIGEPYMDADETVYLPMFRQPVLVFEGSKEALTAAHARAVSRGLALSLFTADLFATGNDRDNRAAVRAVRSADLDLTGIAVYGPRNAVDKVTKGARMHP